MSLSIGRREQVIGESRSRLGPCCSSWRDEYGAWRVKIVFLRKRIHRPHWIIRAHSQPLKRYRCSLDGSYETRMTRKSFSLLQLIGVGVSIFRYYHHSGEEGRVRALRSELLRSRWTWSHTIWIHNYNLFFLHRESWVENILKIDFGCWRLVGIGMALWNVL